MKSSFKRLLRSNEKKEAAHVAVKPWETQGSISQPDAVARANAENGETKDAHPCTDGSVASDAGCKPFETASDAVPAKDSTTTTLSATCPSQTDSSFKADVIDDVSVCNYLGIRRRVLNAARTRASQGKDWDVVGEHAGMTRAWVDAFSRHTGLKANASVALNPIRASDGITSVRMFRTTNNPCVVIVERMSDGKRIFARVRNLLQFPLLKGDCFDAITNNGNLEWFEKGNSVKY